MADKQMKTYTSKLRQACLAGLICFAPQHALAQDNIFAPGWTMNAEASTLRFQSVKNETKVEFSTFGSYAGTIDENGVATVRILMDSVDTNVDLRNVRMRFLLFETFQFPEAVVTMQLDPAQLEDLVDVRRKVMMANYTIELHGVISEREAEIAVTLLDDNTVSVTSSTPISLPTADFALDGGVAKLEEAAKVQIIPSATVTFDFLFNRAGSAAEYVTASNEMAVDAGLISVALEDEGDFSLEACKGRFEIMSRTDNIYFGVGSARLEGQSSLILDSIVDMVNRCPELAIRVDGHTDSDGSEVANQALSEARARSVRAYLVEAGADGTRIEALGFGETVPVVANNSAENKQRNRRIEFSVINKESDA
jgi:outer membrane protein OmpA-like peptidoglycan-associated protein